MRDNKRTSGGRKGKAGTEGKKTGILSTKMKNSVVLVSFVLVFAAFLGAIYSNENDNSFSPYDNESENMDWSLGVPAPPADFTITLLSPASGMTTGSYTGYDITAPTASTILITFNPVANSYVYEINQSGTTNTQVSILFEPGVDTTVILNSIRTNASSITLQDDAEVMMYLQGDSRIAGGSILVPYTSPGVSATLTVDSAANMGSSTGQLTVTSVSNNGNAGIGGASGQSSGTISINGGTVIATGSITGANNGAGIGGGLGGDSIGPITISNGAVVNATGANGAGIGGGNGGNNVGGITIEGGAVVDATGNGGAGIGGGAGGGTSASILITDYADVTARSTNGAAIGGGYNAAGNGGYGGNITIDEHAIVDAETVNTAAIGGGRGAGTGNGGDSGVILITDYAWVSAIATANGLGGGIGGGYGAATGGNNIGGITISENATVFAAGTNGAVTTGNGGHGAGIGGGYGAVGGGGSVGTVRYRMMQW